MYLGMIESFLNKEAYLCQTSNITYLKWGYNTQLRYCQLHSHHQWLLTSCSAFQAEVWSRNSFFYSCDLYSIPRKSHTFFGCRCQKSTLVFISIPWERNGYLQLDLLVIGCGNPHSHIQSKCCESREIFGNFQQSNVYK